MKENKVTLLNESKKRKKYGLDKPQFNSRYFDSQNRPTPALWSLLRKKLNNAYSPYSGFQVSSAILWKDGHVSFGVNVENASYGATICAERSAIMGGIQEGKKEILSLAIMVGGNKAWPPCGMCRQVIQEFIKKGATIFCKASKKKDVVAFPWNSLFPQSFGPKELKTQTP